MRFWAILSTGLDILVLWCLLYWLITLIRGTRASQVLLGLGILGLLTLAANKIAPLTAGKIALSTTAWLLNKFWENGLVILVVVFQPEIRAALARIGSQRFARIFFQEAISTVDELAAALRECARRKIGALVVLEQDTGLKDILSTGTAIDGKVSRELLLSVFNTRSPLHDGAVVIQGSQILAAGCLLPLSDEPTLSKILGTRHRAALGLSEVSDAAVVVVSEETGDISVAQGGHIERDFSVEALRERLSQIYRVKKEERGDRRGEREK